ncbi:CBS domain-containing protein [Candidatus Microgenomates bacterium]|nr:MAG: CBS domain-containing protein [Candidatus Microgenomates bacterium]
MDRGLPIQSLTKTPTCAPTDSVLTALAKTSGSHDAIIVFDKNDNYQGVFYAYKALFSRPPNRNEVVSSVLIHTPYITKKTAISEVLQQMLTLHLYSLPVFDAEDVPIGMVSAQSILEQLIQNAPFSEKITGNLTIEEPFVVKETASIKNVYTVLRRNRKSRIIAVDNKGRVTGIIGRRDLYMAILSPTKKMRLRHNDKKQLMFDKEWITKLDYELKTIMTHPVETVLETKQLVRIIQSLIKEPTGSLVLVNSSQHPTGIVSMRSVIRAAYETLTPKKPLPLIITDRKKVISAFRKMELEDMLGNWYHKMQSRHAIEKLELIVDALYNPKHQVKLWQLTLQVYFPDRTSKHVTVKDFLLRPAVSHALSKLDHLLA